MKRNGDKGLPQKIVAACAAIDAAAAAARGDAVLVMAQAQEAARFQAQVGGTTPATVDAAVYPFIAAEVAVAGTAPLNVAAAFSKAWAAWTQHAAQVERMRATAKNAIRAAKHPDDVVAAQAVTWPTMTG